MKSQCTRLLEALRRGESVTQLDAWARFGASRLAARVRDLRDDGHDITSEWIAVQNRFGEACRVKRYSLAKSAA